MLQVEALELRVVPSLMYVHIAHDVAYIQATLDGTVDHAVVEYDVTRDAYTVTFNGERFQFAPGIIADVWATDEDIVEYIDVNLPDAGAADVNSVINLDEVDYAADLVFAMGWDESDG